MAILLTNNIDRDDIVYGFTIQDCCSVSGNGIIMLALHRNEFRSFPLQMNASAWKVEREGAKDARQEVAAGDKEADKINKITEKNDPDYKPPS